MIATAQCMFISDPLSASRLLSLLRRNARARAHPHPLDHLDFCTNNMSRTFLKRKGGLFKKAHELSVLCSVDVAVFVFGNNKKLYEYSSTDMRDLIGRYQYVRVATEMLEWYRMSLTNL